MHVQADTEAEFRGWIDSLMHEIKRLISEKEKCFASNQKTINDEKHFNANLTSADHVSACSDFVTDTSAKNTSGNVYFELLHFSFTYRRNFAMKFW